VQHVSSINVIELLKHDYVIMPVNTVRWIELVFGEGLSAEEASERINEALAESEAPTTEESSEAESEASATEESSEDEKE
jgi:large subunit ribosomal protein L4